MKSKQETIKMVTDSVSSIFTKDDVLQLLNNLESNKRGSLSLEDAEEIADNVTKRMSDRLSHYVELTSVTVSYGGYGSGVDDQEYELDESNFRDAIIEAITDVVPCSEEDETNSTDNQ